jgi:hypothetical protein
MAFGTLEIVNIALLVAAAALQVWVVLLARSNKGKGGGPVWPGFIVLLLIIIIIVASTSRAY